MATYKWRVPIVQAVQFNGKNHEEVKELLGDTSEGEEFLVGTGVYENPEPVKSEAPKSEVPKSEKPEVGKHEAGKHETGKHEVGKHEAGKPAAKPEQPEAPEVPPTGVPYDPKAKPAEGPKEVKEKLAVAEGDWVVKQTHNGKIEVNPEGFPDGYEFVSS